MDWTSSGLLVFSIGVVVFTFLQQKKQNDEVISSQETQLKQKEEIIKEVIDANRTQLNENTKIINEITLRYKLQLKENEKIISEFKNLITGSDSYLYLTPSKVSNSNEVLFLLEFKGKYPLFDTSIYVEEFDLVQIDTNNFQYRKSNQKLINLGTVNPLQRNSLFQIEIPTSNNPTQQFGKRFFFKINSRNGMVEEDVYLRREGAHFSMAYKVVYFEPDYSEKFGGIGIAGIKRKIRHIDPKFPIHELDHLNGDSGWKSQYEAQSGTKINSI